MRTPRRIRRPPLVAILLLAFTIIAGIYMLRSRTRCERVSLGHFGFFLDCGVAGFAAYTDDPRSQPPREHWRHNSTWYWHWFTWGPTDNSSFSATFSAWPIPLITAAVGLALAARWWFRVRSTRCLKCGYNLTALPREDPCPECGLAQIAKPKNSV